MSLFQNRLLFSSNENDGGRYRRLRAGPIQSKILYLNNLQKRGYNDNDAESMWDAEENKKRRYIRNLNKLNRYKGYENLNGYTKMISWKQFLKNHPYDKSVHRSYKQYLMDMKDLRNANISVPVSQNKQVPVSNYPSDAILNTSLVVRQKPKTIQSNLQLALMNTKKPEIPSQETPQNDNELYITGKVKELIKTLTMAQINKISLLPIDAKLRNILQFSTIPKPIYENIIVSLNPQEKKTTDDALKEIIKDIQIEKQYTKKEVEIMKMAYYPRLEKEKYGLYKRRLVALPMPPTIPLSNKKLKGEGFPDTHTLTPSLRYLFGRFY